MFVILLVLHVFPFISFSKKFWNKNLEGERILKEYTTHVAVKDLDNIVIKSMGK